MSLNSKKTRLYAFTRNTPKVEAFSLDRTNGRLTWINEASTAPSTGSTSLKVHPSDRYVITADYRTGNIVVLPILPDGGVGAATDTIMDGVTAHMVMTSSRGHVFVPHVRPNHVGQYALDETTGKLTRIQPFPAPPAGGPRHMAFAPGERHAYIINESNGTMSTYSHDAASGRLTHVETVATVAPDVSERACAHVEIHTSGKFVYGTNRTSKSIAMFRVDPSTAKLTLIGNESANMTMNQPSDFEIDPTGKFLLLANVAADTVMVFRILDDGVLQLVAPPLPFDGPGSIAIVPLP